MCLTLRPSARSDRWRAYLSLKKVLQIPGHMSDCPPGVPGRAFGCNLAEKPEESARPRE